MNCLEMFSSCNTATRWPDSLIPSKEEENQRIQNFSSTSRPNTTLVLTTCFRKFSQTKVGSFIRLLRLPSPRQEHMWSIHLLTPANINSSTDTLPSCWENAWHSFYYVWKRIKLSSWKIQVFWTEFTTAVWSTDQACLDC